jgi:hypothetical protein
MRGRLASRQHCGQDGDQDSHLYADDPKKLSGHPVFGRVEASVHPLLKRVESSVNRVEAGVNTLLKSAE